MNFAQNQSVKIFLTSFIILLIGIIMIYIYSYDNITKSHLKLADDIVSESSVNIELHFLEKVKTVKAIAITPVILNALEVSNKHFSRLSEQQRDEEIQAKNDKWKTIEDNDHQFILKYTDNAVAQYLKNQQDNLKGEYGEIFITDKYGALIASTSKLTTFAHGSKYWWKGAYNNGEGTVFLDDRGYDDSVEGYVVGVVVPIKNGDEIIGILKVNLNILGSIDKMISNVTKDESEQLFIMRSGGLIVYQEGLEPLSKRVPEKLLEKMEAGENSFISKEEGLEGIYARSEIGITAGKQGYHFGGNFDSTDHKKGNTGESWYMVDFHPIFHITEPANNNLKMLLLIGLFLSAALAFTSMIIGNMAAQPIKELIKQALLISKGEYNSKVITKRIDEIGQLATSFNQMTKNLKETTTSIKNLNVEIVERKKIEQALIESEEKFREMTEMLPQIVFEIDMLGNLTYLNKQAYKLSGYSEQDSLIGKSALSFYIPADVARAVENIKLRLAGNIKVLSSEYTMLRKDGSTFNVLVYSVPILKGNNAVGLRGLIVDISDIKRMQQELIIAKNQAENNEIQLNTILENSPTGFAINRISTGEVTYVNKAFTEAYHIPLELCSNVSDFFEYVYGDQLDLGNKLLEDIKSGIPERMKWDVVPITDKKTKNIHYVTASNIVLEELDLMISTVNEITLQINNEKALKESEEKHRLLAENVEAILWEFTIPQNKWTYVSPQVKRILGYSSEEFTDLQFWIDHIHEDDRSWASKYCAACTAKGESHKFEYRFLKKDGSFMWLRDIVQIELLNDIPVKMRGLMIDITKRKLAEEQINQLSQAVSQSPATVVITDLNGDIEYVNPKFSETTGYSSEEAMSKNPRILKSEETSSEDYKELWETITSGKEWRGEFHNKKKNGELYWELASISSIRNENGMITHYLAVKEEITDRKKVEDALKNSKERIQMLNKIIRHDLSNDFAVINSAVRIFKINSDVTLLDEIQNRVQKSLNAIAGYRKSESFLDANADLDELELSNVINEVAAEYPEIKFKIEGTGRVFADDTLYSVFNNLISNSINHGKASQIDITISSENDTCKIKLMDNGAGIPDSIKEKIFEEGFYSGSAGHTGIGLYIVKKTIENYDGFISVEDNIPNGAVFVLSLRKVIG